ncbi:MAG: hypothetical protein AB1428_06365 [Bacteroidota bacterium]
MTPAAVRPGKHPPARLSPSRRRLFILIMLAAPILFFLLLEAALHIAGYGPNLSLFTTEVVNGKTYHIMNPDVKSRYFARIQFSPTTSLDYFLTPKLEGTFRIFCLGGSTTVGFPYGYSGSFTSFLRDRLRRIFPDRPIEVINLAMTATNSYTVVDIMEELPSYEPDLVIVYDGHNEFYGALGGASRETVAGSRWLIKLYLRAIRWKTFLLARELYARVAGIWSERGDDPGGTMMERLARGKYVELGSPLYRETEGSFRENMAEAADIARTHGFTVIFGTQVSNLRDLPPFISGHSPGFTPERRLAFAEAMNEGLRRRTDSTLASALASFHRALSIDPGRADAHYELARCLDTLGIRDSALAEYMRARDLDELRFRASSDFNAAILDAGQLSSAATADCERKFKANSPGGLIGRNLILEHLHPNLRGNYLIAKEYLAVMRTAQILVDSAVWARRDTVSDETCWEERTVTELDERAATRRLAALTSSWPFHGREAREEHADGLDDIVSLLTSGTTTWEAAHVAAAEYYRKKGDVQHLVREYRVLMTMLPVNVSAYLLLGNLYYQTGEIARSWDVFHRSLSVQRTHIALNTLGAIALQVGNPDSAGFYLKQARNLASTPDERVQTGYLLGATALAAGDTALAREECNAVLSLRPGFPPAERLLARIGTVR